MRPYLAALAAPLLVLGATLAVAPPASAATDVSTVAAALQKSPVYVAPGAADGLTSDDVDALKNKIKDADKPVMVAVLPADFPKQDLFTDLRTKTGIVGVYGVRLGDAFDARADHEVMSQQAVKSAASSVRRQSAKSQLDDFVSISLRTAKGSAPSSWGGGDDDGVSAGPLIGVGAVVVLGGAGVYALSRRNRRKREEERREALDKLRVVVDEDITAFGEELDRLDFHPAEAGADDAMRADFERALDAYEKAKQYMSDAQRPDDVRGVTQALEDGRFSRAARRAPRGPPAARAQGALLLRPAPRPLHRGRAVDAARRLVPRGPGLRGGRGAAAGRRGPARAHRRRGRGGAPPVLRRRSCLRPVGRRLLRRRHAAGPAGRHRARLHAGEPRLRVGLRRR